MIHGARDRPIPKDGTLQRLLVGGLGPAPAVGLPARRFHARGTCNFLIGLGPGSDANDPRRKRLTDPEPRGLLAPAGGCTPTRARTTPAWVGTSLDVPTRRAGRRTVHYRLFRPEQRQHSRLAKPMPCALDWRFKC
jgi:hypothetical protein